MSYSRWSNSVWYTFHHITYSDKRDDQIFEICAITSFTFGELNADYAGCVKKVKELCPEATDKEMKELEGYMERFMDDCRHDISFYEYDSVASCPEEELPLLMGALKTQRGQRALEHRLKGESLDTLEPCDD